ncbi:2'-5' RNA ligase family protein [Streptomyces violaceusniger]|uniref:2'-5' RNA ligase family protein n=1 Tax=Streptomyces violaceusniger TaxID=68280 RepID=UPI00381B9F3D
MIPPQALACTYLYEPYRALAEQPGLCPVRPEWMHITVLHAGPQDSASSTEVDQLVTEVAKRAADFCPFEIALSRPDIGTVAIESKGYPGAPHRALWEMTWEAQTAVVSDRWPRIPSISYPHLSHAYAGAEGHLADRGALKVLLSDLPGGPVTVPVTALTLVAQWHDRREIRWDVLAEVPLGGA